MPKKSMTHIEKKILKRSMKCIKNSNNCLFLDKLCRIVDKQREKKC